MTDEDIRQALRLAKRLVENVLKNTGRPARFQSARDEMPWSGGV